MSNSSDATTTKVVGYYNGKAWPVHLVISELNLTLQLKPGDFIIDRQGRKINDPFFDKYAGQLAKEVSDKPVPILAVPKVNQTPAARDGMAVREVTEFTVDKRGQRTPVMPKPMKMPEPEAASFNPVHGMTLEQAKKMRLVKPTRIVPEDYGAAESDGSPQHGGGIPEIKYATDTVRSKPTALPKELTQIPENAKLSPAQIALAKNLAETAAAVPVSTGADEPGFGNPVVETAAAMRAQPPVAPVAAAPDMDAPASAPVLEEESGIAAGTPTEDLPTPVIDDALPEPPDAEPAPAKPKVNAPAPPPSRLRDRLKQQA